MPGPFPFIPITSAKGEAFPMPVLPLGLKMADGPIIQTHGLLDTGATVNVLPYGLGIRLGAVWESQTNVVTLSGNLARQEARAVILEAHITDFSPVNLVFAWTREDSIPLILGQVNFFQEFDVTFRRRQLQFEIDPSRQ